MIYGEGCCEGVLIQLFCDEGSMLFNNLDVCQCVIEKFQNFDIYYVDDVIVLVEQMEVFCFIVSCLLCVQQIIGYGYFNFVSFEQLFDYVWFFFKIGELFKGEIDFMESVFDCDFREFGFFGEKVFMSFIVCIVDKDVKKIVGIGYYFLCGILFECYEQICCDVGDMIIFIFGVCGMVKQFYFFLMKVVEVEGNFLQVVCLFVFLGYLYYVCGDFDVGKIGFGECNFIEDFVQIDEYK